MSGNKSTSAPETVAVRKNNFALKTRKVSLFLQSSTSSAQAKFHFTITISRYRITMKVFQDFISKFDSTEKHESNFGNLCMKKGGSFQKVKFSFLVKSSMGGGF